MRLDVLLLVVNDTEFQYVINKFCVIPLKKLNQPLEKAVIGQFTVFLGKIPVEASENKEVLQVGVIRTAMGSSGLEGLTSLIEKLSPRVVISVGVGWGNPNLLAKTGKFRGHFGDVMVSQMLLEFTHNAKVKENCNTLMEYVSRSPVPAPGALLQRRFRDIAAPGQWKFTR